MKPEDKELLLKDLCARLPYGIKVKCPFDDEPYTLLSINWNKDIVVIGFMIDGMYVTSKQRLVDIKPYLRPISSMTEEEKLKFYGHTQDKLDYCEHYFEVISLQQDFLLENHFDFRGLIPKDLALSTEIYNPYKE